MTQFDEQYKQAIWDIMNNGVDILSERTGHHVKALPGVFFNLDKGFPLLTLRKVPIKIFVAEQMWFLMGESDPKVFLKNFTSIWDDFIEADGQVKAAYGYRWRKHFGRDQIGDLVKLLTKDPSSRHGVVVTWDPGDDGLASGTKKKNVPCPYTFTVNIIGNKLHMLAVVRSNDMILGCPHDVSGFALLQRFLAAKIGVAPGRLSYCVSNAHIYDIHYKTAWELLERDNKHKEIKLEAEENWFDRAEKGDEKLAEEIIETLSSQYHPLAAIKGLQIVL